MKETIKNNGDRTERLLALLLLNSLAGKKIADKAEQLSLAGFSNVEIADFLQTKPAVIAQSLYENRKKKK
jgi:hypothetical protein